MKKLRFSTELLQVRMKEFQLGHTVEFLVFASGCELTWLC